MTSTGELVPTESKAAQTRLALLKGFSYSLSFSVQIIILFPPVRRLPSLKSVFFSPSFK